MKPRTCLVVFTSVVALFCLNQRSLAAGAQGYHVGTIDGVQAAVSANQFPSIEAADTQPLVEIMLYLDGSPAPDFVAYTGYHPLPTLGIGSNTTLPWHGYVQSSLYMLSNGQIDYGKHPSGTTSITPYNSPYGYEMTTGGFSNSGAQFIVDMNRGNIYWNLITLFNASSMFDVPVDSVYIWQGGWPGFSDSEVSADAGGAYVLSPGGNVTLNATQSMCTTTVEDWGYDPEGNWIFLGYHTNTFNVSDNGGILPYWSINGTKIAFGLTPTLSYDKLVNGLGLTAGTYQLTLDLECYILGRDVATTTLQINAYSGGAGTAEDPYQISTVADWQELIANSGDWDKCFILLNDIDFGGMNLTPVAPDTDPLKYEFEGTLFTGVFDGNSHKLINASIILPDSGYVGMFGSLGIGGQIRNLGVENIAVTGQYNVGGLVGENLGGIAACYANGTVTGDDDVGGLVGWNEGGALTACYTSGTVNGTFLVGGLVGKNHGDIAACYANGTVSGLDVVGGLVGDNVLSIWNCYATGSVYGSYFVGSLVGTSQNFPITACYATGAVIGFYAVGGLVGGWSGSETPAACFWDMETSGQTTSAGGEGKTTAEMKTLSMFTDAGWDFVGESTNGTVDTWRMCANDVNYPRLSWEFSQGGDFDCPDGIALDDLLYLASRWLAATPENIGAADADADGKVDLADFAILAANWLRDAP